ncbi:MAG: glycosyltransferase family 4 protein [Candidatus Latescibacteria bacterium]|nr:glycosyltransferase family 4 protein [Candidatus Latescibacterota bacterium]
MEHYVQAASIRWFNACAYYATTLCRGLKLLGQRVTFVGRAGLPALENVRRYGVEVFCRRAPVFENPVEYLATVKTYRKFALEKGVTLVNVHNGNDHLLWMFALKGTGIPLIRTSGNQIPPKNHIGSRMILKKTAGIIASCNTVSNYYIERFGIGNSSIQVINGGVDENYFIRRNVSGRLRKNLGISDDAFLFGIIGRFSPVKGHRYFISAAKKTSSKYPNARFLICGWDAQLKEADIRSMVSKAGMEDMTSILGRQNDIRDVISSLDAGIIASLGSETICRIAMEYMAMEVPVIAVDTNVIPEIIRDKVTGIIVSAGDSEAMASAMENMIQNRDRVKEMGHKGREIIMHNYTLEAFAEQTIAAYRSFTAHD